MALLGWVGCGKPRQGTNNEKPIKADAYTIDMRRAVIQGQGVMRSRPKFCPWGCIVKFRLNAEVIPDGNELLPLMEEAGQLCGVGDYRPERTGWFGKFTAEIVE